MQERVRAAAMAMVLAGGDPAPAPTPNDFTQRRKGERRFNRNGFKSHPQSPYASVEDKRRERLRYKKARRAGMRAKHR